MDNKYGILFSDELQKSLKAQFCFSDADPEYGERLFFENSGGSLRLHSAVEAKCALEEFPDCPERVRGRGLDLAAYVKNGTREILEIIFGAKSGALVTELSASQAMFHAVGTIMEHVTWGTNAVTSSLEHPSAHDAVEYYCSRTGREFRVVPANKFFGVRGCGFAYVSDRVAKMPHRKLIQKDADVWALGTPTPGNFAAMMAVIQYVCDIGARFIDSTDKRTLYIEGMHRIHMQERALLYRMLEGTEDVPGLRHIKNVEVYVDMEDLTCKDLIIAMGIKGIEHSECVQKYLEHGVTVFERLRSSMYSKRIVEALGLDGAIRVSPLHCHGTDDIDKFLRITKEIAESAK